MEELKNKIYELEGLLELAGKRPEKMTDLSPLITKRLEEINKAWSKIVGHEGQEVEESLAKADTVGQSQSKSDQPEEVLTKSNIARPGLKPRPAPATLNDLFGKEKGY